MDVITSYPNEEHVEGNRDLRDAEGQYKTLFERVNAAALLTTLSGTILDANIKSYDLFGYTFDEFKNISLKELLPLEKDWSQFIDEIAAKGGVRFESEIIRKNQSTVPVEISSSLFTTGNIPQMLTLIHDITERKKNEQRLRESEQKYRGLFELTTDGMIILDSRGEICDVNGQVLKLFQLEKKEMIDQNLLNLDVFPQDAVSVILHQFELLLNNEQPTSRETKLRKANGEFFDAELSSFFLYKKENEVDNFVIVIHDIKERNNVQQELLQTKKRLKLLLENLPLMIYFKDAENRFVLVNNAQAKQFNVTPEEMVGKTEYDFLPDEIAKQIAEEDERIIHSGPLILDQQRLLSLPYGETCKALVTKIPQYDESGESVGLICISQILNDPADSEDT